MNDPKSYFAGKKITVLGLGLLGRGVGDTAYLAEAGAELIVTDMKDEVALKESLDKLRSYQNIKYTLGRHDEADFQGRDLILVAAGVPADSPFIRIAREEGAEIAMSGALFAKLSGVPIIGITGTRGKSTTTHMIHYVLQNVTEGGKILLGGNVRGVSNLQLLNEVEEDTLVVMELDSWQLQGFGWSEISPLIAVFTTFMADHMNYYKGDMQAYFKDKANIFRFQGDGGVLVTNHEILAAAEELGRREDFTLNQDIRLVDTSILPDDLLLSMPGEHNRYNASLATEALRAVGLSDEEIFAGLATFPGVEGRLEYIGTTKNGARVFNDNNATTPEATKLGIESVQSGKNVLLLAGGAYKEVDPAILIPTINEHCQKVVLLAGTGTDKLKGQVDAVVTESLAEAVELAVASGGPGEVILFSPGFASFGLFKNEYDRNDQFLDLIKKHVER